MSEGQHVDYLPLQSLGFANTPAVPYWPSVSKLLKTLLLLALRAVETEPAKRGLSRSYTIDDQTHPAHEFLYGGASAVSEAVKALERKLAADPEAFLQSLADGTALHSAGLTAPTTPAPLTRPVPASPRWLSVGPQTGRSPDRRPVASAARRSAPPPGGRGHPGTARSAVENG